MNKVFTAALIAGGLLLLDSPEAAAHKEVRNVYQPSAYYRVEHRRAKHMPYWLKRDKAFRRWYKRTKARRYRHMSWHRLYDIYLWERFYAGRPYRGDHYVSKYWHDHRYDQRHDHRYDHRHDHWYDDRYDRRHDRRREGERRRRNHH